MTAGHAQSQQPRYSLVEVPRSQAHIYNEQYYRGRARGGQPATGFVVPIVQFPNPHAQPGSAPAEDAQTVLEQLVKDHGWTMTGEDVAGVGHLLWITDNSTFGLYASVDTFSPCRQVTFHISEGLSHPAIEALREDRPRWFQYRTAGPQIEARLAAALERNLDTLAQTVRELLEACGHCHAELNNAQAVALFNEL